MAALLLFGCFFLFMFMRVPVAFALALACLPILAIEPRLDTMNLVQETFNAYNSFILLAVPFFLLTANLMNAGGTTDRLLLLSRTMVGHWPGGLAQINVLLSIFFAGISGSSTADAASQSKLFIEAQRVLKAAVARDRENPFAWYQLGVVYAANGDMPRARLASAEQQVMSMQMPQALASAEAAEAALPKGSPDWLRAQDIALQARAAIERNRKRR